MVYLSIWAGMAGDVVLSAEISVETSNPTRIRFSSSFALGLMKLCFLDTTIDDWTCLLILG